MANAHVINVNDVQPYSPADGICGRAIFGERSMVVQVEFAPHAEAPLHSHPQEQIGIVTRGSQWLTIDGITHEVGEGQGYFIPSGVMHSSIAGPAGSTCIEAFQPIREDYLLAAQGLESSPFT